MFREDDLVPISALQHYLFCDRQAALIHIEQIWVDNALTVEGTHLHETVDSLIPDRRGDRVFRRGVALHSRRLGLTGRADVVEFQSSSTHSSAIQLRGEDGLWNVVPVEYKRGRPKAHRADEVQVCAQAICLEEQFSTRIDVGEIFYWQTRRRAVVRLDAELRSLTESTAMSVHQMFADRRTPIRDRMAKCKQCSLVEVCLPRGRLHPRSVSSYLTRVLDDPGTGPEAP